MTFRQDHLALMSAALAELKAGEQAIARARTRLELAFEAAVEGGVQALPLPTAPVSDHRKEHRPGPPPKIEGDPELQAFIAARVDRLTFHQIAAEVAAHFPKTRQVGKSAIYEWWKRQSVGQSTPKR